MAAKGQRSYTLSDAELMAVGSHGIARGYPKNTIIVSEGDQTDSLYIILEGRVARLLLELAEDTGGKLAISQRLTQREIASRIGASREMVSRILKDLSTGGYLTQSRAGIVLHRKPPEHW